MNGITLFAPDGTAGTETASPGGAFAQERSIAQDRLVEVMAHIWLEPNLADRYRTDARSVLGEFGVSLDIDEQAPMLAAANALGELTIEELTRPAVAQAQLCFCLETESLTGSTSDSEPSDHSFSTAFSAAFSAANGTTLR
ncbi:putative TOMM peptide [Streptomyces albipurpureus]|uniref:TOMM peptide n=1 Tax=Streptomyces albipurpureus TaxID=2897419 RepID=A0ABT0UT68_9ACTN|nr:putative TOMM peptide [Streptomyces sp. CWNU-1]MCM2391789.1 putative TOMM peptide [Streptomyces sp. CWNU-1]